MARLLGEARVSILPDGTRFKPEAEAQVKKAVAGIQGKVKLTANDDELLAKLVKVETEIHKVIDKQYNAKFGISEAQWNLQVAKLKTELENLSSKSVNIKTSLDKAKFDEVAAGIVAKTDALSQKTVKVKIAASFDDKKAEAEGVALREKLKLILSDIKAKVSVDGNSLKTASFSILSWLGGRFSKDLADEGNKGGKALGGGFMSGLGKSALMQNPGITAAVVAGLAALPAAVGAVGVLGGIALGAGILIGAETLISKQLKSTKTAISTLQTQMGGKPATASSIASKQLAIQSTQANISQLGSVKNLTTAQQSQLALAKQRLVVQQQALSAAKQQGQGTAAQQASMASFQREVALLQKEKAAYSGLNNAVANLKQSFLDFAVVVSKPLIKPFTDAIDMLSGQLEGPLKSSFKNLFTAVSPLVKPVEESLLLIVKGILPGLTFMLKAAKGPLTDLFVNFGKLVGINIGQWFRDAVPFIKDSGTYFDKLIGFVGKAGSWLIKFGGATAQAFAGSQFKGFGKIITDIANDLTKLFIPAFEGFSGVMAPIAQDLLMIITPLLNFLANQPGLVKAIAGLAAAWLLIGKAVTIATIAMKLFGVSSEVILAASPFVALAAAIIIAVILIIKYWKPISAFFVDIWKHIWSGFIGPMINFFTNSIPHAFGVTINWLKKNWPLLLGIIGGPIGAAVGLVIRYHKQILNAMVTAWGHIKNVVMGIIKPIVSVVVGAWNEIYKITKPIWNAITLAIKIPALIIIGLVGELVIGVRNLFNLVWPYIYRFTKTTWGHIENAITGTVKPIVSVVVGAWNEIKSITSSVWNWLFGATKNIWGHVENTVTGIAKPIASVVVGAWNTIKSITASVWNWLLNTTKDIWGHVLNVITGILKPIMSVIKGAWDNIKIWTRDAFNWIYDHITAPLNRAWSWISNKFVSGVKSAFSGLVDGVKAIWDGLKKVVADPINFVINSIWNPFANFVNTGLKIFGINDKLPKGTPVKLASGGHVPGYAPGSDTVPAMLSPGEYVLNPTAARAIGVRNLDAMNSAARPGGGQHVVKNAMGHFAGGGLQGNQQIVADAEKYNGHKYVWGGASNPQTGWDCSSFVGYVLGHDFGRLLPGGAKWNPKVHGPVASQYNNTPGFNLVSHHTSDIQAGDLLVENSGGHVGFGVGPNKMFSAFGTTSGTLLTNANNMSNIYRNNGALSSNGPLSLIGSILTAAAQAALTGIGNLATAGLSKVPGKGPMHDLPIAVVKKIISGAEGKLNNNPANFTQSGGGGGIPGGNPAGGMTGSDYANAVEGYKYLKQNLFGGNKIAAAGAVASIDGESTWNPFSVGTGGRGLIGWSPPSRISDATFKGGMRTQLPAIMEFVRANNDGGAISDMEHARSVFDAANIWGRKVERFGINDVHPYGINLGTGIMKTFKASGGLIPGAANFATGGAVNKPKPISAAIRAAEAKKAAAAAKHAAATDAKRVAKLELKPLATLKALDAHYKAKMARDVRTGNYRDYYGSSLALGDVDKAIGGWISPLQREHDMDARGYRKYSSLASKAMASGNEKAFFKDSVQAAKYAAAIAKINKKLGGQTAAGASTFVPLNMPLNRDYMTGFGQFGGQFRLGGTLPEGIVGRGVKSGMSYMMGAGERVVPPNSSAANPGTEMAQTNQLLLSLLAELKTANEIGRVTAQNTKEAAKGLGNAGRIVR